MTWYLQVTESGPPITPTKPKKKNYTKYLEYAGVIALAIAIGLAAGRR